MKVIKLMGMSLLASSLLLGAGSVTDKAKKAGLKAIPADKTELMKLIDPNNTITPERVELGKKLYFEPRLSKSGIISCNTCHNLGLGGADGFAAQFWDGRSPDLEDQAQGPMQAPPEMAAPPALVEERVNSIPAYVEEFKKAYGKDVKVDFTTITKTIGIFERTLVTPSRFDDYLNGNEDALTDAEKAGLATFIDKGCTSCHTGIALGGTMRYGQNTDTQKHYRDCTLLP